MAKVILSENKLFGLILVGGKSSRMGIDKSLLQYHEKPQFEHLSTLLSSVCDKVYFSCNKKQTHLTDAYPTFIDKHEFEGPLGGIRNAFNEQEVDWLIVPIDMPGIQLTHIHKLIKFRDDFDAVCFKNQLSVNPLFGLYSKKCKPHLKDYKGDSAKEFLKTINTCYLLGHGSELMNINTQEQMKSFKH